VGIESLIDEELPPSNRAVRVESLFADHLQFRTKIIRSMRIDPQHRVARRAAAGSDGKSVRPAGILLRDGLLRIPCCCRRWLPVELLELGQIDVFNIPADAALGEGQGHPRLEVMDDFGRDV